MTEYQGISIGIKGERNTRSFGKSVMIMYEGVRTRVRVDSQLSEEFEIEVGKH